MEKLINANELQEHYWAKINSYLQNGGGKSENLPLKAIQPIPFVDGK